MTDAINESQDFEQIIAQFDSEELKTLAQKFILHGREMARKKGANLSQDALDRVAWKVIEDGLKERFERLETEKGIKYSSVEKGKIVVKVFDVFKKVIDDIESE